MSFLVDLWHDPLYRAALAIAGSQVGLLAAMMGVVFFTRLQAQAQNATFEAVSARAAPFLVRYLAGEASVQTTAARLGRLPRPALVRVLATYANVLHGASARQIAELYDALGLARRAVTLTRSVLWWRRLEGVRILEALGPAAPRGPLVARLADPRHAVRLAAARALGRTGDDAVVPALLYRLRHPDWSALQLAEVLVELAPTARPHLHRVLREPAEDGATVRLQVTVLEVLAICGDLELETLIGPLATASSRDLRAAAWRAAGVVHAAVPAHLLREGLSDPDAGVRAEVARACGRVGRDDISGDLVRALGDEDWWVRAEAAEALGRLGPPGLMALREVARLTEIDEARHAARRVLSELEPPMRAPRSVLA